MYRDQSNQPAGYDIELLKMMAKDLNAKLNVLDQDKFDSIVPALLAKKGDLISVGLVNTPARARTMDFSKGYVPYAQTLIVPVDSPAQQPSDLNRSGVTITALLGSTAFFRAQLLFPKATVQGLEQEPALLAVATGKASACVVELYLATPFVQQHGNVKLLNDGKAIATEFGCFGIRQGDQQWLNWLDNWVRYNTDNQVLPGMYAKIVQQPWVQPS
jgi:polar amino acid transport system substrate-binding protein